MKYAIRFCTRCFLHNKFAIPETGLPTGLCSSKTKIDKIWPCIILKIFLNFSDVSLKILLDSISIRKSVSNQLFSLLPMAWYRLKINSSISF